MLYYQANQRLDQALTWNSDLSGRRNPERYRTRDDAITISDEVLKAAHITEPELKQELALTLFQQKRLTLAQASRLTGMGQLAFHSVMAECRIPVHYGVAEFREDLQFLRLQRKSSCVLFRRKRSLSL
jgi:predicted HTH domain antitoxin